MAVPGTLETVRGAVADMCPIAMAKQTTVSVQYQNYNGYNRDG